MVDSLIDKLRAEAQAEIENIEQVTFLASQLYDMDVDTINCLIDPIIPSTGLFSIVGASDTGKSMLFRQLALAVATNSIFLNYKINAKHKKVIFIATEDDTTATSFLLRKQANNNNGLENIRFCFEIENVIEYLDEQLQLEPADLVIIDAWGDIFAGFNQNDSGQIRTYLNKLRSIANKYKCAIGLLHHTGKRTEKLMPSKNNILSGQGFEAKMRLIIELRSDIQDADIKHLCIVKGNYLSKEFKQNSNKLEFNPTSFLFRATGESVPFEELATLSEDGKTPKKDTLKKAHEVDDITHRNILTQIFEGNLKLKRRELETRLSNKYELAFATKFGARRVEQYLDYLLNDLQLIAKNGR